MGSSVGGVSWVLYNVSVAGVRVVEFGPKRLRFAIGVAAEKLIFFSELFLYHLRHHSSSISLLLQ